MTIPVSALEAADSLTLAVIASSYAPLVLLDGDLVAIAASASFCEAFGVAPDMIAGRAVTAFGRGEWNVPQFRSLLEVIASGRAEVDAYEMDLAPPGGRRRRLVINARKLLYGDAQPPRVLLSVSDVTDARLAEKIVEEMLKDKEVLLQELQHRVANSLQIIASVLMQSARRVQSEETRTHLFDAHQRVMSIAVLQKQLAVSKLGDVELATYFGDLCRSIGASMIGDHNPVALESRVDGSIANADVSVSLGLIVTELVINALKHAFPEQRAGIITVDYRSRGSVWTLSVGDDGVGIPRDAHQHRGLGTSIVDALARKLEATVLIADANPGTKVSITHA
ncbi:MAG TPA: histidine kinase dimerization/phosphoacceptor domain -containing protein [Croceibacterium sp.]